MKAHVVMCDGAAAAAQLLPDAVDAAGGKGSLLIAALAGLVVAATFTLELIRERHVHAEVLLLLHRLDADSPLADAAAPLHVLTARADTARRSRRSVVR